jgi:hypothetical protein
MLIENYLQVLHQYANTVRILHFSTIIFYIYIYIYFIIYKVQISSHLIIEARKERSFAGLSGQQAEGGTVT